MNDFIIYTINGRVDVVYIIFWMKEDNMAQGVLFGMLNWIII